MATGTIEFFSRDKGFGFITPDDSGQDVFVHVSGALSGGLLRDGSKVSYDLGLGDRQVEGRECSGNLSERRGVRRYMAQPPTDRAGGCQIGAAASRTATGTVIADALIATAAASLIKRARRARRGSHSYAITSSSIRENSMWQCESPPSADHRVASSEVAIAKRQSALISSSR
jgi:CspA family cold shock protein